MIIVSACLVGETCRYDGKGFINQTLLEMVETGKAIAVCPELLGGLIIPREPCEIITINGRIKVLDKDGNDYTKEYEKGALKVLDTCKRNGVVTAVLKSKSPSCGKGKIYNGCFNGTLIMGNGLTAKMLLENGIKIYNEKNYHGKVE